MRIPVEHIIELRMLKKFGASAGMVVINIIKEEVGGDLI